MTWRLVKLGVAQRHTHSDVLGGPLLLLAAVSVASLWFLARNPKLLTAGPKVSSTIPRFSATDRRRRWGCLLTTARSKVHTNFLSRYYCEYHQRSKQTRRIGTRLPMHFINQIQRRKRGDWISTISVVSGNHSI